LATICLAGKSVGRAGSRAAQEVLRMPERRYLVSMASPMATWVRSIGAGWFGDCWLATEIKLVSWSADHRRSHRHRSGHI
jgi:hypothetical protein